MTLPELCDCSDNTKNIMPKNPNNNNNTLAISTKTTVNSIGGAATDNQLAGLGLGEALKALLRQASAQGRVTCSLTACVELLSTQPDDVMLCVMPLLPHPDAAATIQSTLIRAVCLEHNIRVLSVDCDVKLAKTVVCGGDEVDEVVVGGGDVVVGAAPTSATTTTTTTAATAATRPMLTMGQVEDEEVEVVDDNYNKVVVKSSLHEDCSLFFTGCDNLAPVMGFPCVLVRYPSEVPSKEDELVAEFCKEQLFGHAHSWPYIELPD
ncbi:uncharacterized protein LOC143280136 [Babylonia areolata]|uniref:uncharacterized protein LOC143280136 n=1 Tax=Babylonia areolata TaxID=304850 RepID=UPI003FD02A1B